MLVKRNIKCSFQVHTSEFMVRLSFTFVSIFFSSIDDSTWLAVGNFKSRGETKRQLCVVQENY